MINDDLQMLRSNETVFKEKTNIVPLENNENKMHSFFKSKLNIDLFKIWNVIKIVLLTFFIYITSNALTILIFTPFSENFYTIYGMYVSPIFIVLFVYFNTKDIINTCKLNKINWKLGLKCIPISIFLLLCSTFYFILLFKLGFNLFSSLANIIQTNSIRVQSIFGILIITLIAPISEEFLSRGFLLTKLREVINIKTAIIIQAIFFAVLHGNSFRFLDTFIFGIVLGYFCYYTNSILPGIIIHICYNTFNNLNGLILLKFPYQGKFAISFIYITLGSMGAYLLYITLKRFKYK